MPPTEQQEPAKPNDAAEQAPPPEPLPSVEAEQTPLDPTVPPVSDEAQAIAQQIHSQPVEAIAEHGEGVAEALNEAEQAEIEKEQAKEGAWRELVDQSKPILLRDFNGKVCLEGEWPAVAAIAPILLTQDFTLVDGEKLTITLPNARAVYELAGKDGRIAIYQLTEDYANPAAPPEPDENVLLRHEDGSPLLVMSPQVGGMTSTQTAPLRTDGPTLEEWVRAGYAEDTYPPKGYAKREASDDADIPPSKPRSSQGVVAEPSPGPNPNVKCPECKMFGNRHRPTCSLGGPG